MRIVFASHTHIGGPFVVGSHHLAREMSRAGHAVAHVSTPVTPLHLGRLRDVTVRQRFRLALRPSRADGVLNVVPLAVAPWFVFAPVRWLWDKDTFLPPGDLRRRVSRHLGGPVDLLIVDQPKLIGLAAVLRARRVVYRPTDIYAALPGNTAIGAAETRTLELADTVIATSHAVAEHVRAAGPHRPTTVIANGVDFPRFDAPTDQPAEYSPDRPSRAVYVGALDERFDFPTMRLLADAFPETDFVLVGPPTADARRRLGDRANVRMIGARDHASVPAFMQHARVGLLLLSDHPANAGRSPMKLYEYAASGLPVLAREIPALVASADPFVLTYRDATGAIDAFRTLIAEPPADGVARGAQAKAVAAQHAWAGKAQQLLQYAADTARSG